MYDTVWRNVDGRVEQSRGDVNVFRSFCLNEVREDAYIPLLLSFYICSFQEIIAGGNAKRSAQ